MLLHPVEKILVFPALFFFLCGKTKQSVMVDVLQVLLLVLVADKVHQRQKPTKLEPSLLFLAENK